MSASFYGTDRPRLAAVPVSTPATGTTAGTTTHDEARLAFAKLHEEMQRLMIQLRGMQSVSQTLSDTVAREQKLSERVSELQRQEGILRAELRKKEIENEVDHARLEMLTRRGDQASHDLQAVQFQLTQTLQELNEYRTRYESLRTTAEKDRRDKQIALNCLKEAEGQIAALQAELERSRFESAPVSVRISPDHGSGSSF